MNRRIRNFAICAAAVLIMAVAAPFQAVVALAATAKITFNDPKPAVGTEFTVTVKAATADGNMGGADIVLSYDPAVIEFVSGSNANGGAGTVRLVGTMDSADTKSFDFSLKFKAIQAGNTTISVSSSELYDADMQAMTVSHSGTSSVKVQAPATYSNEASLSSLKISPGSLSPAFSPDVTAYTASVGADVNKIAVSAERKDPKSKLVVSGDSNLEPGENKVVCKVTAEDGKTVKSYTITVTKAAEGETRASEENESAGETQAPVVGELKAKIDGAEYSVAASFDESLLPAGFTASSAVYQDSEIMSGTNGDLTVIYLQDGEGNGAFWFYDTESGELAPYATIHVSEKNITVLPIDESLEIPEGFAETSIQLNGDYKVEGWVWKTDAEQRYCVVYGMNENGEKGLYRYDIGEKTIQRYFEDPALESSYSNEEVEEYIKEFNEIYKLYRLRLVIIIALGAACAVLLILVIVLLKARGGKDGGHKGGPDGGSGRGPRGQESLRQERRTEPSRQPEREGQTPYRGQPSQRIPSRREETGNDNAPYKGGSSRREEAAARERGPQADVYRGAGGRSPEGDGRNWRETERRNPERRETRQTDAEYRERERREAGRPGPEPNVSENGRPGRERKEAGGRNLDGERAGRGKRGPEPLEADVRGEDRREREQRSRGETVPDTGRRFREPVRPSAPGRELEEPYRRRTEAPARESEGFGQSSGRSVYRQDGERRGETYRETEGQAGWRSREERRPEPGPRYAGGSNRADSPRQAEPLRRSSEREKEDGIEVMELD